MAAAIGDDERDVTATEVLGNIDAMRWATETLAGETRVDVEAICEIHRRLLQGTRHEPIAGVIRTTQNWIGGSSYNPCSAAFVPPPERHVRALMEDLCDFVNGDEPPRSSTPAWSTLSSRPSTPSTTATGAPVAR